MRLLPKNSEYSWTMYSVLYFGFFFIDPIVNHVSGRQWLFTGLGTIVFFVLYFGMFWVSQQQALAHIAAMVLLGVIFAPYNGGANTFFIFAAACAPFLVETELSAIKILVGVELSL